MYKTDEYYSYTDEKGKDNLKNLLTNESKGYCMYCYSKILVDRKNYGQLEHSIEKNNSDRLENCIINLSIACPKCNQSFKRRGEKIRALSTDEIVSFEASSNCKEACITICDSYKELKKLYLGKKQGEIILQPFGVRNIQTGNDYLIQYDLLEQKFIPSKDYNYTNYEKNFIEEHIKRFNLNDSKFRTKEISNFCEDIIEYNKIPSKGRYYNLVVDLLIDELKKMELEKAIGICRIIHGQAFIKNKN